MNHFKVSTIIYDISVIYGSRILYFEISVYTILSLTVVGRKNRCIPYVYWATAIFTVVSNYSNLFLPFAFFLDCSHFTFSYELVVCPETAGFMKVISNLFPPIQRDESLFVYFSKIHCL